MIKKFTDIELFAGAGGLALGLEEAGFDGLAYVEFNHQACNTLRANRPDWNVIEADVHQVDFKKWHGKVDLVSGGAPCQAFSYAGKKLGFGDTREIKKKSKNKDINYTFLEAGKMKIRC
jgi:DNA (cytosine-5)-methyltransferase 1